MELIWENDRVFLATYSEDFALIRIKLHGPIRFPGFKAVEVILECLGILGGFNGQVDYCVICEQSNFALDAVREVVRFISPIKCIHKHGT